MVANLVTQVKIVKTYQVTSVVISRRNNDLPREYIPTQSSLRRVCRQLNRLDGTRYIDASWKHLAVWVLLGGE